MVSGPARPRRRGVERPKYRPRSQVFGRPPERPADRKVGPIRRWAPADARPPTPTSRWSRRCAPTRRSSRRPAPRARAPAVGLARCCRRGLAMCLGPKSRRGESERTPRSVRSTSTPASRSTMQDPPVYIQRRGIERQSRRCGRLRHDPRSSRPPSPGPRWATRAEDVGGRARTTGSSTPATPCCKRAGRTVNTRNGGAFGEGSHERADASAAFTLDRYGHLLPTLGSDAAAAVARLVDAPATRA